MRTTLQVINKNQVIWRAYTRFNGSVFRSGYLRKVVNTDGDQSKGRRPPTPTGQGRHYKTMTRLPDNWKPRGKSSRNRPSCSRTLRILWGRPDIFKRTRALPLTTATAACVSAIAVVVLGNKDKRQQWALASCTTPIQCELLGFACGSLVHIMECVTKRSVWSDKKDMGIASGDEVISICNVSFISEKDEPSK